MKWLMLLVLATFVCGSAYSDTYTGKAENIKVTNRGVEFVVVVKDETGTEVLRRDQFVSTGARTGAEAKTAILNVVERFTQDMYAHVEGAKEVMASVAELRAYQSSCNVFVETKDRPSTGTPRER